MLPCFRAPALARFLHRDALPVARRQPRGVFIHDPQRVGAAGIHQRLVNPHVFCSHFNCDKESSLGNSQAVLSLGKGLFAFQLENGGGGIFVWRPGKESDRGRRVILPR